MNTQLKNPTIERLKARQILDSRGNPTIEVDLWTSNGLKASASVPSGASTGSKEALELRDGDASVYMGKSVYKAIENIHEKIFPAVKGMDVWGQGAVDSRMIEIDGTKDKSKLGANAILGVSLALARAGALEKKLPLYEYLANVLQCPKDPTNQQASVVPLMNVINGGMHASNNLDFQEFMIVPNLKGTFAKNLQAGVEVFHQLKGILKKRNLSTNVGDEGGFAPDLASHEMAMELLLEAIEKAHYSTKDIKISLDCAASEFYDEKSSQYKMQNKSYSTDQMISMYSDFVKKYPIYSIEDGLSEVDHSGYTQMTKVLGKQILLVGDDLFVTNKEILDLGIRNGECNSILIKLNQIGTLSETFATIKLAFDKGYKAIVSHRSGETSDSFIADLTIATRAGLIKTGSLCRVDRVEKYNQLLRIEENLS